MFIFDLQDIISNMRCEVPDNPSGEQEIKTNVLEQMSRNM